MKVKELIEFLSTKDPELDIVHYESEAGDYFDVISDHMIEQTLYKDKSGGYYYDKDFTSQDVVEVKVLSI